MVSLSSVCDNVITITLKSGLSVDAPCFVCEPCTVFKSLRQVERKRSYDANRRRNKRLLKEKSSDL